MEIHTGEIKTKGTGRRSRLPLLAAVDGLREAHGCGQRTEEKRCEDTLKSRAGESQEVKATGLFRPFHAVHARHFL
jgi:hypothetical protein